FQATFLSLVRQAGTIRKRGALGGWLYRVSYRMATKARANAARHPASEFTGELVDPSALEAALAQRELRAVLDEELSRLPEKYRAPVVLCYLEGRTNAEAAHDLGWSKGTVSGRLAQARNLLRRRLARRGLAFSAGVAGVLLERTGT